MLKSMKQMEQENRRLLQEEADRKITLQAETEEAQKNQTMMLEADKNKAASVEAEQKKQSELQATQDAENLRLQAEHQKELDQAADSNQKAQVASIASTPSVQAQMPSDLTIKPAPVIAQNQGEYHTRNATGDGQLGSFVVRGSGELDHASKQEFLQNESKKQAEQEKQKEVDHEIEM